MKPDSSVLRIDPADLESAPEELQEALRVLFDEQEQAKAKAHKQEEFEYQGELADTLVERDSSWEEIESGYIDELKTGGDRELFFDLGTEVFDEWVPIGDSRADLGRIAVMGQFYWDLYGKEVLSNKASVLVNHRDRGHPYQVYNDYSEFIRAVEQETSFIYMGGFWQPENGFLTAKRNAMTTINGFCVDLDRVDDDKGRHFGGDWVMKTLVEVFEQYPEIKPNYLMLSGTGIQLWYVFGKQIPLLSAKKSPRRDKYQRVLKALYEWFDEELPKNRFKVDVPCATINHPFRAPASPSKLGYPTRMFVSDGVYRSFIDPCYLSDFLGCDLKPYDTEPWDEEAHQKRLKKRQVAHVGRSAPATEKQLAWIGKLHDMGCVEEVPDNLTIAGADELIKAGEVVYTRRKQYSKTKGVISTTAGHDVPIRKRYPNLYYYTLERIRKETPAGSRYNALFGLAGLAWNCGIPKSQAERDMMSLLDTEWAKKLGHDRLPLQKSDIRAAMKGYNELGALRPREELEKRLLWSYKAPAKRNGRKQEEHLRLIARPIKEALKKSGVMNPEGRPKNSGTKEAEIKEYAAAHPEANHSEIARALGVSRPTVIKWLKSREG